MNILGLIDVPVWLLLLTTTLVLFYVFLTWNFDTFTKMGVPGPKPYPLAGTMLPLFTKYSDIKKFERDLVDKYGPYFGMYEGTRPVLVVSDVDALKQIMIKDFASFTNRQQFVDVSTWEPPLDKILNVLTGEHWKHVRSLATPTFTSGKLKMMMPQINVCADQLVESLQELAEKNEDIDIREHTGNFAMDVIAHTAFGLQLDAQKEKDSTFVKMANKLSKPSTMALIIMFFAPWLAVPLNKIGINVFDFAPGKFFAKVVKQAIEERKSQKMQQSDFLQLMMNAHIDKPTKEDMEDEELAHSINITEGNVWSTKGLTDEEIISQAVLFFIAGYDTTANALRFMCYELAINPEAQEKLIQEVDEVTQGAPITVEMASKLEYVEMCAMETLRKYPAIHRTNREASCDVTVGGIHIPKGMRVDIPIAAIHYDPVVYPDPQKFIPERFTAEERQARSPYHWLSFGLGPRNCIGLRLAMLEIKICMAKIAQKLKLVRCEKTEVPLVKFQFLTPTPPIKIRAESR